MSASNTTDPYRTSMHYRRMQRLAPFAAASSVAFQSMNSGLVALRVLVVDDHTDLADSLATVIEHFGHQAQTAATGELALAQMEAWAPDLVLVDVGLPDMTGYEVAQQARMHLWGQAMTLIAMTGWGGIEDQKRSLAVGFDQHILKPLDLDRLRALLDSVRARI